MKGTKKVISGCLIASMLLPLTGCGKKKGSFPSNDDFISFLKKDLNAEETTEFNFPEEDWKKGFYLETDEFLEPSSLGYQKMVMTNVFKRVDPMRNLKNVVGSSRLRESVNHMVSYFNNVVIRMDHDDEEVSEDSPINPSETQLEVCYATLITFDEDSDALEFFESFMDLNFVQPAEQYKEDLDWYEENSDTLFMRHPRNMLKENIEIEPHEVYDLKTLPEDVYALDEKEGKGHFTYHIDDRWGFVPDMFRTGDDPLFITFVHAVNDLSLQLNGNQVLFLFNSRYYEYVGYQGVYKDSWPPHEFAESKTMGKIYEEFKIADPSTIKISDDLNLQLISASGFDQQSVLHLPEIIRTSDEIPER